MADDRTTGANDAPADNAAPKKKKLYVAPVVLHWGTFKDVTQTNRHSHQSDSRRSNGTS